MDRFRRPATVLLLVSMSGMLGVSTVPLFMPTVQASHGGDDWAPQGPYYDKLLVSVFGDSETALFSALQNGQLDLTDWPVPPGLVSKVCTDPNLHCEFSSNLDMFQLDFNHNPRNKWFGVISGADEQAFTEILRAIAHLTDKDEQIAVTLQGMGQRLDGILSGYPELWGQSFDSLHQGPQTVKDLGFDPSTPNSITVTVSGLADVFLVHVTGNKTKEGVLGGYAGLCRDGGGCTAVSAAVQHPGPDGIVGTLDDEFNFSYPLYNDQAKDGILRFDSVTDSKTNAKIPLPSGTYIVYAVHKDTNSVGWGHITYPATNRVTVNTNAVLSTGGWYNNVPYPNPGYEEYCEARDHLVGIDTDINGDGVPDQPFKDADGDCRIDKDSAIFSAPGYRLLRILIRQDTGRFQMGHRVMDRLNTLFGGNIVIRELCRPPAVCVDPVFSGDPIDDWDIYTGAFLLSRDFDYIDDLYNTQVGYAPCGTTPDPFRAANYGSFCNKLFSTAARATKNTFDPTAAKLATFLHGFALGSIPVWASANFLAYHNAWTGVINPVGTGVNNYYTWINMYPKKDCSFSAKLSFTDLNGNHCWDFGEPITMRESFLSDTQQLNPLWSVWYWDGLVLGLIYDSLQGLNPYSLQEDYPAMASGWKNYVNPTATDLGYAPPAGTALTQRWFVKNHLGWSDGKALTGKDVLFSILAYKETDSPAYGPTVGPVNYVRLVSDVPQQIVMDVGMSVDAPQFEAGHVAGGLPILPCNVYSTGLDEFGVPYALPNCRGITTGISYNAVSGGTVSGVDRNSSFDPTLVPDEDGDGQPESSCADLGSHRTGQKGTGPFILQCTSNGTSRPGAGGSFVFVPHVVSKSTFAKSKEYWASPHNYLVWRWADFNNNGVVDTSDKARTRLNPPLGCRDKPVPVDQDLWDQNMDGVPDDNCIQFDYNRDGVSSDFSDRARITLEGDKRWTHNKATGSIPLTTGTCRWPWPGPLNCQGILPPGYRTVIYPWVGWVWWLQHQCLGPDNVKRTADDDKTACWFTKFTSRPP